MTQSRNVTEGTQFTLDGTPVRTLTVRISYDNGASVAIRASGGLAKAIIHAIDEYKEPRMEEVRE